jgi:hypothetical protein
MRDARRRFIAETDLSIIDGTIIIYLHRHMGTSRINNHGV